MLSIASRIMCVKCNGERLGPCMTITPLLLDLANGTRAGALTPDEIAGLLFYFERLAHLVDIATSNYEYDAKYAASRDYEKNRQFRQLPPVYTAADRVDWLNSKIAKRELLLPEHPTDAPRGRRFLGESRVFVGRHTGILGKVVEVNSNKYSAPHDANFLFGKRFMATVGELAFVLESGIPPGPEVYPACSAPSEHFRLLTPALTSLDWPPTDEVTYGDFFALYHPPVLGGTDYHVHGLMMDRVPAYREAAEADMMAKLASAKVQAPKGTRNRETKKAAANSRGDR